MIDPNVLQRFEETLCILGYDTLIPQESTESEREDLLVPGETSFIPEEAEAMANMLETDNAVHNVLYSAYN